MTKEFMMLIAHDLGGDTSVRVYLLEDLVDVDGMNSFLFLSPWAMALPAAFPEVSVAS